MMQTEKTNKGIITEKLKVGIQICYCSQLIQKRD